MGRPPEEAGGRRSALSGLIGKLRRNERLSDEAVGELERLLDVLRGEGWSGFIAADEAARAIVAGGETETPPEDGWTYTAERIDFAPIWSRADFEKRAREWLAESPPEGTKP